MENEKKGFFSFYKTTFYILLVELIIFVPLGVASLYIGNPLEYTPIPVDPGYFLFGVISLSAIVLFLSLVINLFNYFRFKAYGITVSLVLSIIIGLMPLGIIFFSIFILLAMGAFGWPT